MDYLFMVRSAVNYQKAAVYLLLRISPPRLHKYIVHVLRQRMLENPQSTPETLWVSM